MFLFSFFTSVYRHLSKAGVHYYIFDPILGNFLVLFTFMDQMKKILVFCVFLFSFSQFHAQIAEDKALHFGAGALSGAIGGLLAQELSDGDRTWTYVGAVGTSLLAGLTKEALDRSKGENWDNGDVAATVLGGVAVGVTLDLFSGKKRRKGTQVTLVLY